MGAFWLAEMTLWAQNPVDAVPGGAWAAAGLLGGVLSWLLFVHLPAKDKQLQTLVDKFSETLEKERKDNFTALQYMVERMEAHVGIIADAIRLEFKSINERLEKQDRGNP